MPTTKHQYGISVLFLLLVAFTIWSFNWIAFLIFGLLLGTLYHPNSFNLISSVLRKQTKKKKSVFEWVMAFVLGLILITMVNTYFYSVYKVRSTSMQVSYSTGELVLVDKFKTGPPTNINNPDKFRRLKGVGSIKRSDVIVFHFCAIIK